MMARALLVQDIELVTEYHDSSINLFIAWWNFVVVQSYKVTASLLFLHPILTLHKLIYTVL